MVQEHELGNDDGKNGMLLVICAFVGAKLRQAEDGKVGLLDGLIKSEGEVEASEEKLVFQKDLCLQLLVLKMD